MVKYYYENNFGKQEGKSSARLSSKIPQTEWHFPSENKEDSK